MSWQLGRDAHIAKITARRFLVFTAKVFEDLGKRLEVENPDRFKFLGIQWDKFPDGTDCLVIDGFSPENIIAGENVLFLASFHDNDVTLSQFSVLIVLLQSFIESLTIVLPFYPVGTMERVDREGRVATANTYGIMLSSLPYSGKPNRLMIYDIHTLQNRFYFHSSTIPSLHTSVYTLLKRLSGTEITTVCFPDEGATKRFSALFIDAGFDIITCSKVRGIESSRQVQVQNGNTEGREVVIVDDLVQTGGTLFECAKVLRELGAKDVTAFVAHAVFPNNSWTRFSKNLVGDRAIFTKLWVTNSCPHITNVLPVDDCFEVLDLLPQIVSDLDTFSSCPPPSSQAAIEETDNLLSSLSFC